MLLVHKVIQLLAIILIAHEHGEWINASNMLHGNRVPIVDLYKDLTKSCLHHGASPNETLVAEMRVQLSRAFPFDKSGHGKWDAQA